MHGCPAAGVTVELWAVFNGHRSLLKTVVTGADGRTDQPLLTGDDMKAGTFELVFFVGDYFASKAASPATVRFLDQVPVRFSVADVNANYHIPLVCSPWAYSTYRGS
ncbi:MAG TPA: hydroxyisourate hydrolase [Candidatus Acidoferrum sp.]|nr:hydroxyisourate hydrolase [Candidatus Acidoferrum sp.]